MSSSDDQIIQSVDNIISAVEKLVGDIRVAPDIDNEAKDFALKKVGAVAHDLNQINRALFFNDYEQVSPELSETDAEARAKIIGEDEGSINKTLSAWAQSIENDEATDTVAETKNSEQSEVTKKPRIIVSPVTRQVSDNQEPVEAESSDANESNKEKDAQDFSVASSFQDSFISSLAQSETSLVGERTELEASSSLKAETENTELNQEEVIAEGTEAHELADEPLINEEPRNNDDLTLIKGIDQEVADLLARHGITSFLDIAEFKEADILRLSEELSDPCRVSRENWIEQAALLSQDVSTLYAHQVQLDHDAVFFDRLALNKSYSIHPEVIPTSSEMFLDENSISSLTERLSVIDEQDLEDLGLSVSTSTEKAGDEIEPSENITLLGDREEELIEDRFDQVVSENFSSDDDEPLEAEDVDEEFGKDDDEFTDVLLAKKQALEAELAELKAQMVRQVEVEPVSETETISETEAKFVDYQDAEIEDETEASPIVEVLTHEDGQNEISDVFSSNDDEEETANISSEDDLGDGPIWHEEVSMGKDYVPPVVEDDFEREQDVQHFSTSDPSFTQREFHQEPIHQENPTERAFTHDQAAQAQFTRETVQGQFTEQTASFSTPQDTIYTERQDRQDYSPKEDSSTSELGFANRTPINQEVYTYSVDQLSEHAPTSRLDEMRDFPQQRVPVTDVPQPGFLEVPTPESSLHGQQFTDQEYGAVGAQTRGLQGDYHASPEYAGNPDGDLEQGFRAEFRKGQVPEVPTPPQANLSLREDAFNNSVEEIRAETSPLNQAEYMDDISVPKTSIQSDLVSPLPPSHLPPVSETVGAVLGANETVSDKVPEIKEKMTNGQTLGQYLATKAHNELPHSSDAERRNHDVQAQVRDDQQFDEGETEYSSPMPPQNEDIDEFSQQDRSISLPPAPPHAPQINMADMRGVMAPPSGMPQPPAPPVASGIKVPPAFSGDGQEMNGADNTLEKRADNRHEHSPHMHSDRQVQFQDQRNDRGQPPLNPEGQEQQRSLPPFPPQALQPGRPPHGVSPKGELVEEQPLRAEGAPFPNRGPIDGPTPPPFTDMPSPVSEGQAYADTQRIIAAKRRADAEKAMNRSDIPNGQAYMDTQQLMDNGVPFEPQQTSNKNTLTNELPPLPPEAVKAASAYPKTPHSPEMSYRGQKPPAFKDENLPSLEEPLEDKKPVQSSGFTAKAKKFAESLQRSFVDKE